MSKCDLGYDSLYGRNRYIKVCSMFSIVLSFFKETCEEYGVFAWMLVLKERFYYFDFAFFAVTDP